MAKDVRYFVDVCLEIYVPDQGCGEQALNNESKDANWFANEICNQVADIGKRWDVFVHGAGTGGTMMGVKRYIDDKNLNVKCVLTQPAEDNASHGIQGINDGADFLLDRSLMDETISIKITSIIVRSSMRDKANYFF